MTLPFGAQPNAQGGPPQGGQGQQFNQGQGLPSQQQGYVPNYQPPPGGQYQPQFQPPPQQQQQPQAPFVPQTHQMPSTDTVTFPAPYFPPPQQQQPQQQTGFPAPQQQPHQQQQGGYAQQLGYGQPQQQQGQGGWQQMPVPQQQPQQQRPQQASGAIQQDHLGRLWGPGLPANLQGATYAQVQQALGLPNGQQQQQPQQRFQPQQVLQQPQQQQQAQQTPTQQGQVAAAAQPRNFWADPEGAIERIVDQRLQPITHSTQLQAVQAARDAVASQYPEFLQYENDVIQRMQGLDPQLLGNPQAWRIAFEQAVGERYLQQQRGQFRQQPNGQQQQNAPAAGWQPYQPQQNVPGPRLGDFFTESPSQGISGMDGGQQGLSLSPQQQEVARRFGYSNGQYLQGMGARY